MLWGSRNLSRSLSVVRVYAFLVFRHRALWYVSLINEVDWEQHRFPHSRPCCWKVPQRLYGFMPLSIVIDHRHEIDQSHNWGQTASNKVPMMPKCITIETIRWPRLADGLETFSMPLGASTKLSWCSLHRGRSNGSPGSVWCPFGLFWVWWYQWLRWLH